MLWATFFNPNFTSKYFLCLWNFVHFIDLCLPTSAQVLSFNIVTVVDCVVNNLVLGFLDHHFRLGGMKRKLVVRHIYLKIQITTVFFFFNAGLAFGLNSPTFKVSWISWSCKWYQLCLVARLGPSASSSVSSSFFCNTGSKADLTSVIFDSYGFPYLILSSRS